MAQESIVEVIRDGGLEQRTQLAHFRSFDFELEVGRRWTSPTTGAVYPAAWRLRVPDHDLELAITPRLANQEHDLSVLYWEGSVDASGARGGLPIAAEGYVELTGYPAAR